MKSFFEWSRSIMRAQVASTIGLAIVLFFAASSASAVLLASAEMNDISLSMAKTDSAELSKGKVLGAFNSAQTNFTSQGQQVTRFDTDGNAIDAHDGEIQYFNGTYYLYGTSYTCGFKYLSLNYNQTPFCGFKVYSSTDLRNWKFERLLFDPSAWQGQDSNKNCPNIGCFRPHILARPATAGDGYVLWFNIAAEKSYWVMESSSPAGPFTNPRLAQNVRYTWNGDEALFLDSDNTAYLVHTNYNTGIPEVGDLVIEKLNSSFTDSVGEMINTGFEGEAPSLIKRNGIYFLIYSHNCPYCSGTPTRYLFSSSINGPWQDGGIINPNSCGGQPTYVSLVGGEYMFMSDLWHSSTPPGTIFANQGLGNYYWGPLTFDSGNKPVLSCQSVPSTDSFVSACNIGSVQLMQTFKPANSGQLAAVDFVTFQSGPQSRPDSKDGSLDGSILPNADLNVQVVKLNGNQPVLPVLASFSVSSRKTTDGYLTPPGKIDFAPNKISLPLNVAVEAGQEYGLLLKSNLTTAGCYGYAYNENNIYSQGRLLKSSKGGSSFSEETGRDIKFNVSFTSAPVAAISNNRPIGYLDGVSSDGKVFGWAIDNDNNSQAVKVHLYFDKNAGTAGASPVEVTAGDYRGDVGTHAFNFQIPNQIKDGQYHQVWAWAIDLSDNAYNAMLIGSPKIFKLASTVTQPATITNSPGVTYGPNNLRAYKDIKSVTWYDFPRSIPDSYENLVKVLPQIKAEGYNTVWLGGNAWADYSPKALPTPTYNEQAFAGLIKILELLKTNNMEAIIGLNYLGQGWSPEGIDACRWMLDETMYKAFEDYSKEFLSRIQNYSNNVYIVVFTEGSEGSCLGDPYKPELRLGLLQTFQSRLGSWPLRVPAALRSKFRIGYHDYALINENYSGGQSPLSNPNPYDFMSMVAYGVTGKTDTQITEEVKLKATRFKALYPYTPLIIGEMGAGFCVPYSEDIQAQNVKALVNAAISNGLGFNLWQWKSLPDGAECSDQNGLGIHKNDGVTLRKAATAVSSILSPGLATLIPTPTPTPLACVNRQFNASLSGYYSSQIGGSKLSSIQPSGQYFVKCNYGVISGNITPDGQGSNACNYVGWDNLSAVFKCTAPASGAVDISCRITNNQATDNSCNAINSLGSLNVQTLNTVSARTGQLVSYNNTIYLVAQNGKYGFPDLATFNSWSLNFSNVVAANSAEINLPKVGIVPTKLSCYSDILTQINSGVTSCPTSTTSPSLTSALDGGSSLSKSIFYGSSNIDVLSVKLIATGDNINLSSLEVTSDASVCPAGYFSLYDGATLLSSVVPNSSNCALSFDNLNLLISQNSSKTLTLKVTPGSFGNTTSVKFGVRPAKAIAQSTGMIFPIANNFVYGNVMTFSQSGVTPTPTPTPTPTTLACVQRNFNTNTSGFYSGASKVSSLTPGQNFTIKCDYGIVSGYITLEGNGAGNCGWNGWSGTAAQFSCVAPSQNGLYSVSCRMASNPADNSCSALNPTGSYSVGLAPTPTPTVIPTPVPTVTPAPTPVAVYPRVGQLVNINSTVYLVGQNGRYGFPDLAIFNSWGLNFANVVLANSAEIALPQAGIVPTKLSCYSDIISQITANVTSCPDPVITRDVMAKKLVEKFPLNVSIGLNPSFNDVSQSNQYYSFIEQIYSRGITNGCYYDAASGIRNYCPTEPVKRWQAMLFLARTLGSRVDLNSIPTEQAFRDVPSTNIAYAQTQYFYQRGVTIGCRINSDGTRDFCPDDNLTESQFNLLIERIYATIGY